MGDNAAGSGNPGEAELRNLISQVVNEEFNKAITGWSKRELPRAITGLQDQLSEAFLERLAQELPSDDEIDEMELAEFQREAEANGMSPEEYAQAIQATMGGEEGLEDVQEDRHVDPRMNGQLLELRRANERLQQQMQEFQQAREDAERRAEETDRFSTLNGHLSDLPWRDGKGREIAFDYLKPRAKRAEDGTIVIDDLPAKQWIDENGPDLFAGFFQPKAAQGAGAFNSGFGAKGKGPDTDQIRPGMSAEEAKAVGTAALTALGVTIPNL